MYKPGSMEMPFVTISLSDYNKLLEIKKKGDEEYKAKFDQLIEQLDNIQLSPAVMKSVYTYSEKVRDVIRVYHPENQP